MALEGSPVHPPAGAAPRARTGLPSRVTTCDVRVVATPAEAPAWFTALCSRGWTGTNYRSHYDARQQAAAHVCTGVPA